MTTKKKPKRKPPVRFTIAEIAEAWNLNAYVYNWLRSAASIEFQHHLKTIARRRGKGKRK